MVLHGPAHPRAGGPCRSRPGKFLSLAGLCLVLAACDPGPTAPAPPAGEGELFFVDSGCACSPKPWPPIPIFVDGTQAGLLPFLGQLAIPLPPGPHTWSYVSADDPNATHVVIVARQVITVQLLSNLDCGASCPTPPPAT